MNIQLVSLAVLLVLGAGVAQAADLSPREIYEQASPGVVMVMGYPNSGSRGSGGTGSIIQQDGLVLTNAHVVIEEATGRPFPRLHVYLKPDRVTGDPKVDLARGVKARVVAYSQSLDLALLKLEETKTTLPVVALSDSDATHIGDRVVAIGHPEQGGLWTLTTGVISAEFENFNGVSGKHVFQTETGLNRGNSGGPLLDGQGHMVAVNTAIARVAPDGLPITSISFSLKSDVAKKWLREQGVAGQQAQTLPQPPASSKASTPAAGAPAPSQPSDPIAQPKPVTPVKPVAPPATAQAVPPARPYNLDQLISERSRAEADLEDMIKEMRGKMNRR